MTIIVPPDQDVLTNGVAWVSSSRKFNEVDRLAKQLAQAAGYEVHIVEGALSQAPDRGFIFVYDSWELDTYRALGPRIILLNADRGALWNGRHQNLVLDRCGLAAAVENADYSFWTMGRDGPRGLHGLESVAKKAGMAIAGFRSPTSDYGELSCREHCHSLAELIVHYLTVYEEMGLHARNLAT